jgi:hypothetical protein
MELYFFFKKSKNIVPKSFSISFFLKTFVSTNCIIIQ